MMHKNLRTDDQGIIPLLIGAGLVIASIFGISLMLPGENFIKSFLMDTVILSITSIVLLFALMGKFEPMLGRKGSFALMGIGAIVIAIVLWHGGYI